MLRYFTISGSNGRWNPHWKYGLHMIMPPYLDLDQKTGAVVELVSVQIEGFTKIGKIFKSFFKRWLFSISHPQGDLRSSSGGGG